MDENQLDIIKNTGGIPFIQALFFVQNAQFLTVWHKFF